MRDENGLTLKQAAFVQHITSDCLGNGRQAAIKAGYSLKVAHTQANENLNKPHIKLAIEQKLKEIAENKDVSVEWIVEKLKKGYDLAVQRNNVLATARFLELLGRYKAMFTDNLSTTDTQRQRELDDQEKEEAAEFARWRLSQKYGLRQPETQCKAIIKVG